MHEKDQKSADTESMLETCRRPARKISPEYTLTQPQERSSNKMKRVLFAAPDPDGHYFLARDTKLRKTQHMSTTAIPSTKPKQSRQSIELHPLVDSFNESAQSYRKALMASTCSSLDDIHTALVKHLHEKNSATIEGVVLQSPSLGVPLADEKLLITTNYADGRKTAKQTTLGVRMDALSQIVTSSATRLFSLNQELDVNFLEIIDLVEELLGKAEAEEFCRELGFQNESCENKWSSKKGIAYLEKDKSKLKDTLHTTLISIEDTAKTAMEQMSREEQDLKKNRTGMKRSLMEIMQNF